MAIGYDPYADQNPGSLYQPFSQNPGIATQGGTYGGGVGNEPNGSYMPPNGNTGINMPGGTYGGGLYGGSIGGQQPNWQSPTVTPDQVNSYFASRGVTPNSTSAAYFAQKWPELYQRGLELGNPNYAFQRLQYADEFLGNDPTRSPFYEGPQQNASGAIGSQPQPATVTPSANAGTVAPTWTAMLGNGSAYKKQPIDNGSMGSSGGLTLAQLLGMGSRQNG